MKLTYAARFLYWHIFLYCPLQFTLFCIVMLIQFSEQELTCSILFLLPFSRQCFKGAPVINIYIYIHRQSVSTVPLMEDTSQNIRSFLWSFANVWFSYCIFSIIAHFKIVFGSRQPVCQSAHPIPQSDHMNKHLTVFVVKYTKYAAVRNRNMKLDQITSYAFASSIFIARTQKY